MAEASFARSSRLKCVEQSMIMPSKKRTQNVSTHILQVSDPVQGYCPKLCQCIILFVCLFTGYIAFVSFPYLTWKNRKLYKQLCCVLEKEKQNIGQVLLLTRMKPCDKRSVVWILNIFVFLGQSSQTGFIPAYFR